MMAPPLVAILRLCQPNGDAACNPCCLRSLHLYYISLFLSFIRICERFCYLRPWWERGVGARVSRRRGWSQGTHA